MMFGGFKVCYISMDAMLCRYVFSVHVRFIFHALVCEVMRDVLPSLPLKCDIMFLITCMFISACMFIITSCPHLNCHFLMNKLSLPMAVDFMCLCKVGHVQAFQSFH